MAGLNPSSLYVSKPLIAFPIQEGPSPTFTLHLLPLDILGIILGKLDVASWDRLRRVSSRIRARIDNAIILKSKYREIFQQANCSIRPINLPTSSCRVLPSPEGRTVARIDNKLVSVDNVALAANLPDEYKYLCSQNGCHFYFTDDSLIMVDSNGQNKQFNTRLGYYEPAGSSSIRFVRIFLRNCAKPEAVLITKNSNQIICVTKGGTLLKWDLDNPNPILVKQIAEPPLREFKSQILGRRYPDYPPLEEFPTVRVAFTDRLIIVKGNDLHVSLFDLDSLEFISIIDRSSLNELKVIGDYLFICVMRTNNMRKTWRGDDLHTYKINGTHVIPQGSFRLKKNCDYYERNRIIGMTDRFLVVKNIYGFSIVDVSSKKEIQRYEFSAPAKFGCERTHENYQVFHFDHALLIINKLEMEISVLSIPFLHVVATVKLDQMDEDFTYLESLESYSREDGIETYYKIYPKNTLKFTNVIYRNDEFLISYEIKKPGTDSTCGKILRIGKKSSDVQPQTEIDPIEVGNSPVEQIELVQPPPPPPVQAPIVVEKKFPFKQVAIIGVGAGIALISTIVFACLTFRSNSTSLYKSLLGRSIMIASALSFGALVIGGTIFAIKKSPKRKTLDDVIQEAPTRVVRVKRGWFTNTVLSNLEIDLP